MKLSEAVQKDCGGPRSSGGPWVNYEGAVCHLTNAVLVELQARQLRYELNPIGEVSVPALGVSANTDGNHSMGILLRKFWPWISGTNLVGQSALSHTIDEFVAIVKSHELRFYPEPVVEPVATQPVVSSGYMELVDELVEALV